VWHGGRGKMIVLIILSTFIGMLFWMKYKSFFNPATMFLLLWAMIFVLYEMNLLNYYELRFKTIVIYYVQTAAFVIGATLTNYVAFKSSKNEVTEKKHVVNEKLIYVLSAITVVFLFGTSIDVIKSIIAGDTLVDIADAGNIITENNSVGIDVGIKILVVDPITVLISPLVAGAILSPSTKRKWLLFALNVIIVLLHTFQHGGRDMLIVFGVSYMFALVHFKKANKGITLPLKIKIIAVTIAVTTLAFSVWISKSRGIEELDASLYYYLSGAVPHLQSCIDQLSLSDLTLGLGFIYGLIYPIMVGLRGLGVISQYPSAIRQIGENFSIPGNVKLIGNDTTINAHVGLSYYFYSDGGILFVFFGCFALGFAAMYLYKRAMETNNNKNISLYLFMMCVIIMSFIRFQLSSAQYTLALLYLATFIYKKERSLG
jgi:oligosaccharide repeat unit polymerase